MTHIPLLLLPGLLCDARLWRDQIEGLADIADATVADLTLDDSVEAMAARALAMAPPTFALAGLSMGGYVAFEIMRQAPDRVTHLALLDTSAKPDDEAKKEKRRALMALAKTGKFKGVTPRLLPTLVHADHLGGAIAQAVTDMATRVGADAFLRQQQAIMDRPDSRPLLGQIKVATLALVGDADALTPPAEALEIHQGVAGSRLVEIERSGHLSALEQPDAVTAVMRAWLTGR